MRKNCRIWMLSLCLMFLPAMLRGQAQSAGVPAPPSQASSAAVPTATALLNPKTPEEFFARARQLSDLEASGIPFHLKATFVATGDAEFTGNGTYEEWWQSKDLWRKEATLGDYKYVAIRNGDTTSGYATGPYVPLRLRQAMDIVLIRIVPDAGTSHKWKMTHMKMSGTELAVLSNQDGCKDLEATAGSCIQDRFTADGDLRIHLLDARIEDLYNNLQTFHKLLIARSVTEAVDGAAILTISIASIEPLGASATISSQNASAPKNLVEVPVAGLAHAFDPRIDHNLSRRQFKAELRAKGLIPPKLIHNVELRYPESERERHRGGVVVIACTIDTTGAVREPYVQLSDGVAFDAAAMEAVRHYRFKPAMKHGKPIMVDMNIELDFHIW